MGEGGYTYNIHRTFLASTLSQVYHNWYLFFLSSFCAS